MWIAISIVAGALVGFSLGLSGAGGSLLAVPILIYGLSLDPRSAFTTALAATGAAGFVGAIPRIVAGQVEVRTGICFAFWGMIGAPAGTWFATMVPDSALLGALSILMVLVACRMWYHATRIPRSDRLVPEILSPPKSTTPVGGALTIPAVGLATGFLSGTFGVGCGFVIVPALVLISKMSIHRAVGTALLIMGLVSCTGAVAHFRTGGGLSSPDVSCLFVLGAICGVVAGGRVSARLSSAALTRTFAVVIVAAALLFVSQLVLEAFTVAALP